MMNSWRKNQEVLDRRLDSRVDDMMSRGLVDELADFHHLYNERRLRDEIKYVSTFFFFCLIFFFFFLFLLKKSPKTLFHYWLADGIYQLP